MFKNFLAKLAETKMPSPALQKIYEQELEETLACCCPDTYPENITQHPWYINGGYQEIRATCYPSHFEYMDAQYKLSTSDEDLLAEGQAQLDKYLKRCELVKTMWPKPE